MRAVIVGAGWAGLLTAANLRARGVEEIVLLDKAVAPGGVADTVSRDGYILEPAAGSFLLPQPGLAPFVAGEVVAAAANQRHVWDGTSLVTIPAGPKAVLAPLVSSQAKLRAAVEPWIREPSDQQEESLDRFLRRRFGDEMGRTAAWLAASGVFAGDPALLSADAAFPQLTSLADKHGSVIKGLFRGKRASSSLPPGASALSPQERQRRWGETAEPPGEAEGGSPQEQWSTSSLRSRPPSTVRFASRRSPQRALPSGDRRRTTFVPATTMSDLAATLVRPLGDRFRPGVTVDAIRREGDQWTIDGSERHTADHVVVTTDPHVTAGLVRGDLAAALAGPVAAPVAVVGLGGQWMELPEGFGILTGPNARTATRGVLLESSYAPHRAPEGAGLVKVIAGGAPDPSLVDADDASIIERVGSEVARMLGHDLDVSFTAVVRHRPGIPQYVLGHGEWVSAIEAVTPDSLHLTGWGYRGVGISHLAADATRIADAISAA